MGKMIRIFGHDVDILNVAKVVAIVAGVFSLNNAQQRELDNYVKLYNYEWVEKRKHDSEIESLIEEKVRSIK